MVYTEIPRILNLESSCINNSDRPSITIHIFHSFDIINSDKITRLIVMRILSSDSSFLSICNIFNRYSGQFFSTMKHIPFLPKIRNHYARISKLARKHDNSLQFLLSNSLIDRNNPTKIIYITKDYNIIF